MELIQRSWWSSYDGGGFMTFSVIAKRKGQIVYGIAPTKKRLLEIVTSLAEWTLFIKKI